MTSFGLVSARTGTRLVLGAARGLVLLLGACSSGLAEDPRGGATATGVNEQPSQSREDAGALPSTSSFDAEGSAGSNAASSQEPSWVSPTASEEPGSGGSGGNGGTNELGDGGGVASGGQAGSGSSAGIGGEPNGGGAGGSSGASGGGAGGVAGQAGASNGGGGAEGGGAGGSGGAAGDGSGGGGNDCGDPLQRSPYSTSVAEDDFNSDRPFSVDFELTDAESYQVTVLNRPAYVQVETFVRPGGQVQFWIQGEYEEAMDAEFTITLVSDTVPPCPVAERRVILTVAD